MDISRHGECGFSPSIDSNYGIHGPCRVTQMALQIYFEDSGFAHVKLKDTEFTEEKWRLVRVLLAGCKLPKIKNPSDTQQNKKFQTKGKHTRKLNQNRTTVGILNLSHSKHTTNVTSDVL